MREHNIKSINDVSPQRLHYLKTKFNNYHNPNPILNTNPLF